MESREAEQSRATPHPFKEEQLSPWHCGAHPTLPWWPDSGFLAGLFHLSFHLLCSHLQGSIPLPSSPSFPLPPVHSLVSASLLFLLSFQHYSEQFWG